MSKNYYKIDVMGGNGYSFMVCTSETNEDAVIELAQECFSDPDDMDRASIDPLVGDDDINHFKSCGCLYDIDGDEGDPAPAVQGECLESVATVQLRKVNPGDNDLLLSIIEVKKLMLVFIGTIVCNNTKAEIIEDGGKSRAFNTIMFGKPQKYGGHEIHGLTVNTDGGSCEDCIPDIDFLTDADGVRSIPSDDMSVETVCELCVDIAESFGMGDSMKGMFGEIFGNGDGE